MIAAVPLGVAAEVRAATSRLYDYFAAFDARLAALLAEQAAGVCHFHVLVGGDGEVLGRFNLVDVAGGEAELGFRVAERAAGRGIATGGVRRILVLARDDYGLRRLTADAAIDNAGSRGVLRATGFVPAGPIDLHGRPALRHTRDLTIVI